jgi:PAS domain-containing protein
MKRECAWCRKELGRIHSPEGYEHVITHGICEDCRNNMEFQLGVDLGEYLDSLGQPIVVVDGEGTVVSGNASARTMLGKGSPEIEGHKGGDVFECAYARLPEGCGNTIHCSGCTIRRTVMETHKTGKSSLRVPATLNRNDPEDPDKITLLISTEKIADVVLLRIDAVDTNNGVTQGQTAP